MSYTISVLFAVLLPPNIYNTPSSAPDICWLLLDPSAHLLISHIFRQALYPLHGKSSDITAPSNSSGRCWMSAPLSQGPQRRRLLDISIYSEIITLTKPHNSEYSRFILKLSSVSNLFCSYKASTPGIPSAEYTIWVKERLCSRQSLRYRSFLSLFDFAQAFLGVVRR